MIELKRLIRCKLSSPPFLFMHLHITQSALTWDVSYLGRPPKTSSCARATDRNMLLTVPLFVDLHHYHLLLPIVTLLRMVRSPSLLGLRTISVLDQRHGGTRRTAAVAAFCYDSIQSQKYIRLCALLSSSFAPTITKSLTQDENYSGW